MSKSHEHDKTRKQHPESLGAETFEVSRPVKKSRSGHAHDHDHGQEHDHDHGHHHHSHEDAKEEQDAAEIGFEQVNDQDIDDHGLFGNEEDEEELRDPIAAIYELSSQVREQVFKAFRRFFANPKSIKDEELLALISPLKETLVEYEREEDFQDLQTAMSALKQAISGGNEEEIAENADELRSLFSWVAMSDEQRDDVLQVSHTKKIPALVITGFLGSGKTTLLNYILREKHGKRIAVIENEFGEIGIDDKLVDQKYYESNEEIFEMNNGCICCTVRGDLIRILKKLKNRSDKFDYILIETTGLADPAPVAQGFFVDDEISSSYRLDGIVTVVDAKFVVQHLDDEKKHNDLKNETAEQIAFADVLLLNKMDLVREDEVEKVEMRIRKINQLAKIIHTTKSVVDLDQILNIRAFDLEKVLNINSKFLSGSLDDHHHDDDVISVAIQIPGDMDREKIDTWLQTYLTTKAADVFRFKGIFALNGFDDKFVISAVHMLVSSDPLDEWQDGEERVSTAVFIGRNLDREELEQSLRSCLAD